ncbi:MAG: Ig-like domain-containing protein, partial [Gemmatimonadota bacterium]
MFLTALLMLVQVQQPATPPAPAMTESPVAELTITPAGATLVPGDTLRLVAVARDASGKPVENVRFKFTASGRFEAKVDSTGLVSAGSTGTIPVTAVAIVPGAKPVIRHVEIRIVAGPASRLAIDASPDKLVAGQTIHLGARTWSSDGDARDDKWAWKSSNPAVLKVQPNGMVTAAGAGKATLTATVGAITDKRTIQVVANTISRIVLKPAQTTARQGDVIRFTAQPLDAAGKEVAGLTPNWSFSPGQGEIDPDGGFVGYQAGEYTITASFGRASAEAVVSLAPRNVRHQVEVVGRLPRSLFTTEEVWVHPDGKHAYLGTGSGGDRMYAIDISDPSKPTVTDSVMANTRRVNDIMTTPDGKFLVFTREGAADRKNGIVICSLEDPAHPKPIAEFTDGVTGGVHSAFIYNQAKYGTHVYLTNDGTGALHILDINDPYHPREVAQWRTNRPDAGRTLHDVDVQDGLAYLSYWNDGLVILDIGNGMAGGSPSNPVLVSQYKYDLNALYRDVEARSGPGFIRGTHTAWRHNQYVFIADEVFPAAAVEGAKDASAFRAFGRLQVLDVSDLKHPRSVAWYEPEYGGVHNVWVAGDTLYMGAYN